MAQKSRQGRYIALAGEKLLPADITDISALTGYKLKLP